MSDSQVRSHFVTMLTRFNIAAWLYKITVTDFGNGHGVVDAENGNGCTVKAFYEITDGELVWTETEWGRGRG